MFLHWFFPNFAKRGKRQNISWEASQFLYYMWRKISHERRYRGTSAMIHVQHVHYDPIREEVEQFLIRRGYAISYFESICGRLEIIIHW